MKFNEKLIQLRKSESTSQEELAARIDVSRQAISRWETGAVIPDAENLLQLSKVFGVSIDYLLHDGYESDQDIPAVTETAKEMAQKQRRQLWFVLFMGGLGIGALLILTGIFLQLTWPLVAGLSCQAIFIVLFEGMTLQSRHLDDAKVWKGGNYRTALWALAVFPAYAISQGFLAIYPRPYPSIWCAILMVALYLLICGIGSYLLRKKGA